MIRFELFFNLKILRIIYRNTNLILIPLVFMIKIKLEY